MQASRLNPFIAYIAKMAGRPVKLMLPKDQELAQISIKPENRTTFKAGARKDGRIVALLHEIHLNGGDSDAPGHSQLEISKNQCELYTSRIPHWRSAWFTWKTNAPRIQPVRSYTQQEVKWAWEHMMDEMAEAVGMDPLEFRLRTFQGRGRSSPRTGIPISRPDSNSRTGRSPTTVCVRRGPAGGSQGDWMGKRNRVAGERPDDSSEESASARPSTIPDIWGIGKENRASKSC